MFVFRLIGIMVVAVRAGSGVQRITGPKLTNVRSLRYRAANSALVPSTCRYFRSVSQAHHNFAVNVKLPPLKPFKNLKQLVQIRVVLKVYPGMIGHDFKLLRHALDEAR
jgi:hypothetical protein